MVTVQEYKDNNRYSDPEMAEIFGVSARKIQYFRERGDKMQIIDGVLSHVLGRDDILITSRNIYGGAHQLIHDWYAKPGNLKIAVEIFDGYDVESFQACWEMVQKKYKGTPGE